jgi:hypothetical protein
MWENIVERGRPQMTMWRMRIACWIPKATNTHSSHVLLIAFPLQQWLHERVSVLRYMYIDCTVHLSIFRQQTGRQKILDRMVQSSSRILCVLNLFMHVILIY